jgi:hypothetical protein
VPKAEQSGEVTSHRDWRSWAFTGLLLLVEVFLIYVLIGSLTLQREIWHQMLVVFLVLLLGWWLPILMTENVRVSSRRLTIKNIYSTKEYDLALVVAVHATPTLFGRYFLILESRDRGRSKHVGLPIITHFSNYHELVRSVLESAFIQGANPRISEPLLEEYGGPPYGIFSRS